MMKPIIACGKLKELSLVIISRRSQAYSNICVFPVCEHTKTVEKSVLFSVCASGCDPRKFRNLRRTVAGEFNRFLCHLMTYLNSKLPFLSPVHSRDKVEAMLESRMLLRKSRKLLRQNRMFSATMSNEFCILSTE